MADIFISYANQDRDVVRTLAESLRRSGFSVYFDEHLLPGEDYRERLDNELAQAAAVVLVWSHHSVNSSNVLSEAERALAHNKLYPVRVDDVVVPQRFSQIMYVDLADLQSTRAKYAAQESRVEEFAKSEPFIRLRLSLDIKIGRRRLPRVRRAWWSRWTAAVASAGAIFLTFFYLRDSGTLLSSPKEILDARKPNFTAPRFVRPTDEANVPSTRDGAVLIFVHGVFGDTLDTWKGRNGQYLWDYVLARPEFSKGYDAFAFGFVSEQVKSGSFRIKEAAQTLHTVIVTKQLFSRYKRIVVVAHSLGGLVTVRALIDFPDLRERVPVVVTYGTPYEGSQITTIASRVLNNPTLVEMFPNGDYLTQLRKEWSALRESGAPLPRVLCAYEKVPLPGVGLIVEEKSAVGLCSETGQPIAEDHMGMVKPNSDNHGSVDWLSYALLPLRPTLPSGYQDVLFDVELIRSGVPLAMNEKFSVLSLNVTPGNLSTNRLGGLLLRATADVDPSTAGKPPLFQEARLVFYAEPLKAAQRVTHSAVQLDLDAADDAKIWNRSMELVQNGITSGHASGGKNILLCIKGQTGERSAVFWGVDLGGIGWTAGEATRLGHYRIERASASFGGTDVRLVCEGYAWQ